MYAFCWTKMEKRLANPKKNYDKDIQDENVGRWGSCDLKTRYQTSILSPSKT